METQEYLAEFLRYGVYRKLKSDHKTISIARIICSTNKNLYEALQEGTFSRNLFEELHTNVLIMPSLTTIPKDELHELIEILVKQTLQQPALSNLLGLTEREEQKLLNAHLPSLHELRIKIKHLLTEKSKHTAISTDEETFDPAHHTIFDEELVEAAQLGRHALKNKRVMGILWKKFQNQNKIAMFLGVNRSSVNRRCKEHGFIE
jgi:DNA-binding NtrC family response regulator